MLGFNRGCLSPSRVLTGGSNLDIFNNDKVLWVTIKQINCVQTGRGVRKQKWWTAFRPLNHLPRVSHRPSQHFVPKTCHCSLKPQPPCPQADELHPTPFHASFLQGCLSSVPFSLGNLFIFNGQIKLTYFCYVFSASRANTYTHFPAPQCPRLCGDNRMMWDQHLNAPADLCCVHKELTD